MTVAIGGAYATTAELRRRQGIPDGNTYVEADLEDALLAASRQVDRYCGRQFGRAEVATARTFPVGRTGVDTADFWTTDDLMVGAAVWTPESTSYTLLPQDGVVDGVPGWPYYRLEGAFWVWPGIAAGVSRVQITAKWGWADVPEEVKSATLMLAAEELKLKDTTFGVAGFGDYAIRVRSNPKVAERLAPFRLRPVQVAS